MPDAKCAECGQTREVHNGYECTWVDSAFEAAVLDLLRAILYELRNR